MSRRRKKNHGVIKSLAKCCVIVFFTCWLLVACVTQHIQEDDYSDQSHIGQVEMSPGEWISAEHYEQYMSEREAYLQSETESAEAEREAFMKSLEETTVPEYMHRTISEEDAYMLTKIAMAEAEGEDIIGKALVIRVVLNRVSSSEFP